MSEAAEESGIFAPLIGHPGAKAILRSSLRRGDVHLLLSGPPASGKSVALLAIEEAIDGAMYEEARGLTERKLRDKLADNPPVLLLDEFDNMKQDAFKALNTALEQGRVTKSVTHDSYDKEIETQVFAACNHPDDLPGDVSDRFVGVDFDPYTRSEYIDVCEVLLPDQVAWVADADDAPTTAREIARVVWDETDSRSPRTARDAARLADAASRVPKIVKAMNDPKADVDSEPLSPDELPHNQPDATDNPSGTPKTLADIRDSMADKDDVDKRTADEVKSLLSGGDEQGDDGPQTGGSEPDGGAGGDTDTPDPDDGADDDEAGEADADGVEADSDGDDRFVVDSGEFDTADWYNGVPDNMDVQAGYDYLERLMDSGNQVIPNSFPKPTVEIIVPRDVTTEAVQLAKEHKINPMAPDIISQPASIAEEEPDVGWITGALQFELADTDRDTLSSSGFEIEKVIDGLEGEVPFVVTKSPSVDTDIPV